MAAQSFTLQAGSPINVSANPGDTISINLPVGNSGAIESSWAGPLALPTSWSASGGTQGGVDPVTFAASTSGTGTLNWIDATGTTQATAVNVTVAASPAPPTPTPPGPITPASSTGMPKWAKVLLSILVVGGIVSLGYILFVKPKKGRSYSFSSKPRKAKRRR